MILYRYSVIRGNGGVIFPIELWVYFFFQLVTDIIDECLTKAPSSYVKITDFVFQLMLD